MKNILLNLLFLAVYAASNSYAMPFKCDEPKCTFRTNYKHSWINHKLVIHGKEFEELHQCAHSGCGYKATREELDKHNIKHLFEIQVICEECYKTFGNIDDLTKHKEVIHFNKKKPYKCDEPKCTFRTINIRYLKRHKSKKHGKKIEKLYHCTHSGCNYQATIEELDKHNIKHLLGTQVICEECDEIFSNIDDLTKHKELIKKKRPYKCDEPKCTFRTTRECYLKRHKLNKHNINHHLGIQFICEECDEPFGYIDDLTKHKELIHTQKSPAYFSNSELDLNIPYTEIYSPEINIPYAQFYSPEINIPYAQIYSPTNKRTRDESDEELQQCDYSGCDYQATLDELNRHKRKHFNGLSFM